MTSVQVSGKFDANDVLNAVNAIKKKYEDVGDVFKVDRKDGRITVKVDYSVIDYRRSEFNQVQNKDGEIEFQQEGDGFVVRSTHNDYLDDVRDAVLALISADKPESFSTSAISLQGLTDPAVRSKFFFDLIHGMPSYRVIDVTDAFVYKPGEESDGTPDPHIERVGLRGTGLTQTEHLRRLANDGYYIFKVGWRFAETLGLGTHLVAEVTFSDPVDCTGFSYILLAVHDVEEGAVLEKRRPPSRVEIAIVSKAIEKTARSVLAELTKED